MLQQESADQGRQNQEPAIDQRAKGPSSISEQAFASTSVRFSLCSEFLQAGVHWLALGCMAGHVASVAARIRAFHSSLVCKGTRWVVAGNELNMAGAP